jgi:hypothetical protein
MLISSAVKRVHSKQSAFLELARNGEMIMILQPTREIYKARCGSCDVSLWDQSTKFHFERFFLKL